MALSRTEVAKALSSTLQVMADYDLAWQLQAEEYKKAYQQALDAVSPNFLSSEVQTVYQYKNAENESVSFTLRPTLGDRDCFFHAVNVQGFNRQALVNKLLENATNVEVSDIFAHEIRQFLYLGNTGVHPDEEENKACQQLLTIEIKQLFSDLKEKEEVLRVEVEAARTELSEAETKGKHTKELLRLLQEKSSLLVNQFENAYQAVSDVNEAIYQYCCRQGVFEQYVKLYLEVARGYIPFYRDFGTETPKTTIDIINELYKNNDHLFARAQKAALP